MSRLSGCSTNVGHCGFVRSFSTPGRWGEDDEGLLLVVDGILAEGVRPDWLGGTFEAASGRGASRPALGGPIRSCTGGEIGPGSNSLLVLVFGPLLGDLLKSGLTSSGSIP